MMSYDSKLEGMMTLAIAMSSKNSDEGAETVQKAQQIRAKNSCKLPRNMKPNQAAFEALGFIFTDIGDDVLFKATLPEGWSTEEEPGATILWEKLIDDKGRVRGKYYYKGSFYNRSGQMNLFSRYHLTDQFTDPDNFNSPTNVVVTDFDGSIIFNAGQCKRCYSKEYNILVEKAKEYLLSHYPEWKDATKYWD